MYYIFKERKSTGWAEFRRFHQWEEDRKLAHIIKKSNGIKYLTKKFGTQYCHLSESCDGSLISHQRHPEHYMSSPHPIHVRLTEKFAHNELVVSEWFRNWYVMTPKTECYHNNIIYTSFMITLCERQMSNSGVARHSTPYTLEQVLLDQSSRNELSRHGNSCPNSVHISWMFPKRHSGNTFASYVQRTGAPLLPTSDVRSRCTHCPQRTPVPRHVAWSSVLTPCSIPHLSPISARRLHPQRPSDERWRNLDVVFDSC